MLTREMKKSLKLIIPKLESQEPRGRKLDKGKSSRRKKIIKHKN